MGDRIGQQLGNYRLIRLLGEGGFAEVYLGEHIHLGTHAAIKVLHTQLGSEDASAFGAEARTIAHLIHPNIVRVLEFGIEGKTPFLVMDYAPNGTLRQRHAKGTILPPATIVPYIKQTAAALQYAHDQKLIHRDIKPENMLMGRSNEILLSDFGIALVAQSSRYQNTQDVVGTVAYMSPEQIQGKPRPASDQYSLAIVAYEWLSGDRPFHGSFTELCTQHMFATPAPIRGKLPSISPAVDEVLQMALAKDPHQRFGSMQAFANAFEQAIQPGRVPTISSTPPPPRTEKVAPPPQPHTVYAPPPPPIVSPPYGNPSGNYSGYSNYPNYNNSYGNGMGGSYPPIQQLPPNRPAWQAPTQRHPWSIGKREILAGLIGIIIYGICKYSLDLQSINTSYNSSYKTFFYMTRIGNIYVGISPRTIVNDLVFAIALFLAVAYGPWVALFVTGLGTYLADYFAHITSPWNWYMGFTIMAFIASIAYMRARGNNKTGTPIFSAIFWTIVGLIIGASFTSFSATQIQHYYTNFGWSIFIIMTIPQTLVAIVVFIISLSIYNSSAKSSQQRQGYR
ncbi:MAG TPA: protein kinase [Ktedonobacteraceae bacterium]|nr:protein kinase [Ktedonobacteraceae bacterium]